MTKIAFMFSGQGAQYPGMMKDLYDEYASVKKIFNTADTVLGRPVSQICFEGTPEDLALTHNTQPCILAADLAAFAAISSIGIKADILAGFSLGEYAALVASRAVKIEDAFQVVQIRADAMQSAVPLGHGGMAVVLGKNTEDAVLSLCAKARGYIQPANYNSPDQIVVSGDRTGIVHFLEMAKASGIIATELPVSAPFHCKLMEPATAELNNILSDIAFYDFDLPVISNVTARSYLSKNQIQEQLVLQAKSPVLWQQTLIHMKEMGVDTFIELGPGKTLSGFVKKTLKGVRILNVENIETLEKTREIICSNL